MQSRETTISHGWIRPVQRRRTSDDVVAQVIDALTIGDLQEGDRLPSERDLTALLALSRPTVREALSRLADARVIRIGSSGAVVLSELVPPALLHAGGQPPSTDAIREVLEARRLLESRVAQLATVHGDDQDFAAMATTIDRQRTLGTNGLDTRSGALFLQLDTQFHLRMARATRNSTVFQLASSLLRDVALVEALLMQTPFDTSSLIDLHERTLESVRARKLDAVDRVMDEHLAVLERRWEDQSGRGLIRPVPEFLGAFAMDNEREPTPAGQAGEEAPPRKVNGSGRGSRHAIRPLI